MASSVLRTRRRVPSAGTVPPRSRERWSLKRALGGHIARPRTRASAGERSAGSPMLRHRFELDLLINGFPHRRREIGCQAATPKTDDPAVVASQQRRSADAPKIDPDSAPARTVWVPARAASYGSEHVGDQPPGGSLGSKGLPRATPGLSSPWPFDAIMGGSIPADPLSRVRSRGRSCRNSNPRAAHRAASPPRNGAV